MFKSSRSVCILVTSMSITTSSLMNNYEMWSDRVYELTVYYECNAVSRIGLRVSRIYSLTFLIFFRNREIITKKCGRARWSARRCQLPFKTSISRQRAVDSWSIIAPIFNQNRSSSRLKVRNWDIAAALLCNHAKLLLYSGNADSHIAQEQQGQ